MAIKTKIEWTDRTYNPWIGCSEVSPGCRNCYAKALVNRRNWDADWKVAGRRKITKTAGDPVRWNREARDGGTHYTVFCASLADVFEDHPALSPLRVEFWRLVKATTNLNWMILTKRPENISKMLPPDWGEGYANVCLMVSVENQCYFDRRVPLLRAVPARYRALSVEPLIGPLRLPPGALVGIDLVIVGGESGPKARPMHPEWVREARDACLRDGVKFFFKQWGNWTPDVACARADLCNGMVFTDFDVPPLNLASVPLIGDRQTAVVQAGASVVFRAKSKDAAGSEIDGQTYKEHIFTLI